MTAENVIETTSARGALAGANALYTNAKQIIGLSAEMRGNSFGVEAPTLSQKLEI
jgi:hypothetical protein